MREVALLGNPGTKRTIYLTEHAAPSKGLHVHLLDWNSQGADPFPASLEKQFQCAETFLKIDPPLWDSCILEELNSLTEDYQQKLSAVGSLENTFSLEFFNHPDAISALLDKRSCKDTLLQAGLPVTQSLGLPVRNPEELLDIMKREHMFQVFIKPVYGSGAAGTAAFRFQPKTGQMVLYTCALKNDALSKLVNTKRLRRFTDKTQIFPLLEELLSLNCIIERWYAKAEYNGFSYDLRAVIQEGRMDFLLARLSKGPITNLHLNNHPLSAEALSLPPSVIDSISDLCQKAAACYPKLRSAGIDILLEKDSLTPRIIEMNGQGDLIYQDIYGANLIYRHQADIMKKWQDAQS